MTKIDARLAQAAVLLDRQFLLTQHLIKTSGRSLGNLKRALDEERQNIRHVLSVYNYVFSLIDHLVRYQKIAHSMPRLSQKSAEFRALNDSLKGLKEVRNQIQHINNDIENQFSGPLLGAIVWASGSQQCVVTFHDLGRKRSSPSIPFDSSKRSFTKEFCYVYDGDLYDLDKAIGGFREFNKYVQRTVKVQVDGKPYLAKDHFMAIGIRIEFPSHDLTDRSRRTPKGAA